MVNENENKIGLVFLCKTTFICKNFFKVETANGEKGMVYINEVSDYYVNDLRAIIKENDIIYLTLKSIQDDNTLIFSLKENKTCFLKTPFEFNFSKDFSDKFQNLFNFTNEEIKKWKK